MAEINEFLYFTAYIQQLDHGIQWSALCEALLSTNTEFNK